MRDRARWGLPTDAMTEAARVAIAARLPGFNELAQYDQYRVAHMAMAAGLAAAGEITGGAELIAHIKHAERCINDAMGRGVAGPAMAKLTEAKSALALVRQAVDHAAQSSARQGAQGGI